MIAAVVLELWSVLASGTILATEDDGDPTWLLILGPVGAGAVYFGLWSYYRNTHKSHSFERETRIEAQPVTGTDAKVNTITGTKSSTINGNNRTNHRKRVHRFQ